MGELQQILIVEDDPYFSGQLADLFQFQGYDVVVRDSSQGVLAAMRQRRPSVVILDLVLPGGSGVDLARAIRADESGRGVPIFLMSAVYRDPRMFEKELRKLGIVEFLPKPFSPIDLGRKVDALLSNSADFDAVDSRVTSTGSWRLEELQAALGEGPTHLGSSTSFDRRSLLQLCTDLFRRHAAGCLSLTSGDAQKDIYFLNGYPVAAESNLPQDSLANYLVAIGLVEPEAAETANRHARLEARPLRDVLLSRGLVPERKLRRAERRRVRAIFTSCFEWPSGAAEFAPGELEVAGRAVTEVNTVGCLWEAVQSQLTVDELEPELAGRMNQVVERGPRYSNLVGYIDLPPKLLPLLDALDEGLRLQDLFERFRDARPELVRALWIMLSLGIAKAEGPALAAAQPVRSDAAASSSFGFLDQHHPAHLELDYYEFLGVQRHATSAQLEEALRRLYALYGEHSDDASEEAKLDQLRRRLQVAFRTLIDPSERKQYDQRLAVLDTGEWTWPLPVD